MVINRVLCTAKPSIVIEAGKVTIAEPVCPDFLNEAPMLIDAENASAFDTVEVDGVRHVRSCADGARTWTGKSVYQGEANLPFLLTDNAIAKGRTLLDFGSYYNQVVALDVPHVGGGYLSSDSAVEGLVEMFIVAMDREEVKDFVEKVLTHTEVEYYTTYTRAAPFVGADGTQKLWFRGNRTKNGENSRVFESNATLKPADDCVQIDGMTVSAYATAYPDGLHVLNVRTKPDGAYSANFIASDRKKYNGGIRMGLVAGFTSALTDAERTELTDYLLAHWIENGPIFDLIEVKQGALFDVADGVKVRATVIDRNTGRIDGNGDGLSRVRPFIADATSVRVASGTVMLSAVDTSDAFFHVDASLQDARTVVAENGTNFVSRWEDVNGNGRYASREEIKVVVQGVEQQPLPFIRSEPAYKMNGLDVVDFGGYYHLGSSPADPNPGDEWSYGASLRWSEKCSNVREFFTVAKDTEDLKGLRTSFFNNHSATRAAPFMGSDDASFLRCNRSTNSVPIMDNSGLFNSLCDWGKSSPVTTVDGVAANSSDAYPDGFHVLNSRIGTDAGVTGNNFTRERMVSAGGQRIGEFMVYTAELSATQRAKINGYLMAKWLNADSENVPTFTHADVEIGEDATLVRRGAKISVSGSLRLDGTIEAFEVATGNLTFGESVGTIKGRLALGASGTVVLDWDKSRVRDCAEVEVKLCEANALIGDVSGWKGVTTTGNSVSLAVRGNALYGTVRKKGLILLFR